MIYGVDVSERDGSVNWIEMKEKGIDFVMLCAGYGSGSVDLQFRKNAEACNRLGISCGAYWISYAYTVEMAEQEAECCIETVEEFELAYPLCVKYDFSSIRYAKSKGIKVTKEFAWEMTRAFGRRAERKGYAAMSFVEPDGCRIVSGIEKRTNL